MFNEQIFPLNYISEPGQPFQSHFVLYRTNTVNKEDTQQD